MNAIYSYALAFTAVVGAYVVLERFRHRPYAAGVAMLALLLIAGFLVWNEPLTHLLTESATPPQPVHASFDVPGVAFTR